METVAMIGGCCSTKHTCYSYDCLVVSNEDCSVDRCCHGHEHGRLLVSYIEASTAVAGERIDGGWQAMETVALTGGAWPCAKALVENPNPLTLIGKSRV